MFKAIFPLAEIIVDFFDELKSVTSGYGRSDYISIHFYGSTDTLRISFQGFKKTITAKRITNLPFKLFFSIYSFDYEDHGYRSSNLVKVSM